MRSERCAARSTQSITTGFEDGEMGSQAPECGKPAEAGQGKEMNFPLEPPEGNADV